MRPNVIFVIMDDLCWGDLACHGNPHTRTPQLDQMREESTRLTRYSTGPLCSPARASIITGRYHLRTRVIDTYCGRSTLEPDEPTLSRILQAAGYRTGAFGKWHLGDVYPSRACDLGFEESLMHNAGGIGQPGDRYENHARGGDSYFDPVLMRNGKPEQTTGYCTDIFFDAAMEFVARHRDEPFFCYLATNAPHSPLVVADQWADPYRQMGVNDTHARLYGMVENIDWNMGRLMARLRELGLDEKTLVVYTSDHGPCGSAANREAPPDQRHRYNSGLRGLKGSLYQGGIQVPSFWRWPEQIVPGHDIDRVASPVDVLPTLLDACGVELPTTHTFDGTSLLPLLTGEQAPEAWPDRTIYMQWHRGDIPIRFRNGAAISQQYKYYRPHEDAPDELYDLQADLQESINLAGEEPAMVEALRSRYEAWFDDMGATRGPRTYDPVPAHIGTDSENPVLLTRNDWRVHGTKDAWYEDDVRCHWEVRVASEGDYAVDVRFKPEIGAGTVHFTLADVQVSVAAGAGEAVCTFDRVRLPAGLARLEAWRSLDTPQPGALHQRFAPPLYVEITRL